MHPLPSTCHQGTSSSGGYCLLSNCRAPHPVPSAVHSLEFNEPGWRWAARGSVTCSRAALGSREPGCPDIGGGSWLLCIAAAGLAAQRSAQVLRGHVRRHFRGWRCACCHPQIGESDLLLVENHRAFQYWSILKLGLCIFIPWFFVSFSRSKSCFVCAQ